MVDEVVMGPMHEKRGSRPAVAVDALREMVRAGPDYARDPLRAILNRAWHRAMEEKGRERHARDPATGADRPFDDQPIVANGRKTGPAGPLYQVLKKVEEALTLHRAGDGRAAVNELLDVINYAAAAVRVVELADPEDGARPGGPARGTVPAPSDGPGDRRQMTDSVEAARLARREGGLPT